MSNPTMTVTADTSELERNIPMIAAFGRRTVQEQCVTSLVFIALRSQKLTRAATTGQIDADMEVVTTPIMSTRGRRIGLPLRSGRKRVTSGTAAPPRSVIRAALIVSARANPGSAYNARTGSRWALAKHPFKGVSRVAGARAMADAISRMVNAKHSSTHFLQTGFTPMIRAGLKSPLYRYNSSFGSRAEARAVPNARNKVGADQLGSLVIDLRGDDCVVTGENAVGEPTGKSNSTLAAHHREALLRYGLPAVEQAIAEEAAGIAAECERRFAAGMKVQFPEMLRP